MSQRIALSCPTCQKVSYRPVSFAKAKTHFVCNYCHDVGRIDRDQVMLAPSCERSVGEIGNSPEPISGPP